MLKSGFIGHTESEKMQTDVMIYRIFFNMCYTEISKLLGISEASANVIYYIKISERYENENYKDKGNDIVYDTKNFIYPAYITIFNSDYCYEYALINEEECKIIYVFTQFIEPNNVKFDKKYLPVNFGEEKSSKGFNIYYSENGLGYFERHNR